MKKFFFALILCFAVSLAFGAAVIQNPYVTNSTANADARVKSVAGTNNNTFTGTNSFSKPTTIKSVTVSNDSTFLGGLQVRHALSVVPTSPGDTAGSFVRSTNGAWILRVFDLDQATQLFGIGSNGVPFMTVGTGTAVQNLGLDASGYLAVGTGGGGGSSTVTNLSPIIVAISNNTPFAFFSETNSGLLNGGFTNDLWDIGTNANKGQIVALGTTNAVNDLTNVFLRIPNLQVSGRASDSGLNIVTNTLYTNTGNSFGFLSGTAVVTGGSSSGLVTLDYTNNGAPGRQQAMTTYVGAEWKPMFALIFPGGTFRLTASGTGTGSATIASFTFVNQNQ